METVYYLTHPRIDKTAVVYAPSTEKARTTFLDWLERNNFIRRANRHFFRKDMVAERIEDPNVPTDVILNYGYKDFSGRFGLEGPPEVHDIPVGVEEPEVYDIPVEFGKPEVHDIPVGFEEPKVEGKSRSKLMPVQQVMLGGYLE